MSSLFSFLKSVDENQRKTIADIHKMINDCSLGELYPYVDMCIKIVLTMAVSNYSAERLFPVMKQLKNYLRSTMSNSRQNWQAVLTIECDLIKKLNFEDIINSFAKNQSRRKIL